MRQILIDVNKLKKSLPLFLRGEVDAYIDETEEVEAISIEWLLKKAEEYDEIGLNSVAKELRYAISNWEKEMKQRFEHKVEKKGKWIIYMDCEGKTRTCTCSICGYKTGPYTWENPNFCANCGADMRGIESTDMVKEWEKENAEEKEL